MRSSELGKGMALLKRPEKVEASLWRQFKFEQNEQSRQKLFDQYMYLAKKIAKKEYHRRPSYGLELEDFYHFAFAGLLEAVDRYDPIKNVPFEAYGRLRILGSIKDGLSRSSEDGAQYNYRKEAQKDRIKSLESPDLKTEDDTLTRLSDIAVGLALGFILQGHDFTQSGVLRNDMPDAYESLAWKELKLSLKNEVENLQSQEKTVIQKHYFRYLAFVRIAELLRVTKGRVSQIHRSAINKLRQKIRS